MMRRQLRRRRERRRALNELLARARLATGLQFARMGEGDSAGALRSAREGACRAACAYELGRALYHLAKRRHFKERDLADGKPRAPRGDRRRSESRRGEGRDEDDKRRRRQDARAFRRSAEGQRPDDRSGARAARSNRSAQARRARRARLVEDEFERIVAAQAAHHAALADQGFVRALRRGDLRPAPGVLAQIDARRVPTHARRAALPERLVALAAARDAGEAEQSRASPAAMPARSNPTSAPPSSRSSRRRRR